MSSRWSASANGSDTAAVGLPPVFCWTSSLARSTMPQRRTYDASTGDVANTAAGKCLDVTDRSSGNGARAQIWTRTGAANQTWQLR